MPNKPSLDDIFGANNAQKPSLDDIFKGQNNANTPQNGSPPEALLQIPPEDASRMENLNINKIGEKIAPYASYPFELAKTAVLSPASNAAQVIQGQIPPMQGVKQTGSDLLSALQNKAPQGKEYLQRNQVPELGKVSDVIPQAINTPFDVTGRGTLGTLLDVLGTGAGSYGAAKIAEPLAESAATQLASMHLRPTPGVRLAIGKEGIENAANEALDSGAIGFGSKADTTAANLEDLVNKAGAAKGDIVNSSNAKINPLDIGKEVDKQIEKLRATSENQPLADAIQAKKNAFLKHYGDEMTPGQLETEKTAVQKNINYKADPSAKTLAQEDYARALKEGSENAITDPNFIPAKNSYQNLVRAQAMADRTSALTDGGLMAKMADVGLGHAALNLAAHGNPAALPLIAARGLTKGRLSSAGAVAAKGISKAAKNYQDALRMGVSPSFLFNLGEE